MKRSVLATSVILSTLTAPAFASSIEGFSAGSHSVRGSIGHLNILTPHYETEYGNTSPVVIDISAAKTSQEAVDIIREAAPDPRIVTMLENYPQAPTSAEGIAAFEALTGTSVPSDSEFQQQIDFRLTAERYIGLGLGTVYRQGLLTQTATQTIVSVGANGSADIYSCDTAAFTPTTGASEQASCQLIDSNVELNDREIYESHNGSFISENFLYSNLNTNTTKFYGSGGVFDIPMDNILKIRGVAHREFYGHRVDVYDQFSPSMDFKNFYINNGTVNETNSPIEPESFLYTNGFHMVYDQLDDNGVNRLFIATPTLTGSYSGSPLPIKLTDTKNPTDYGFIGNFDYLTYEDINWNSDPKNWLALGYFGSEDLGVITPTIYDYGQERFFYLSSIAVKHLSDSTPEGFIDAVKEAIKNTLPNRLANVFPILPEDLTGLSIDPDITQEAYTALINERIMRVAISGALLDFNNNRDINAELSDFYKNESRRRWTSSEFRFTSASTLRAPYASYDLRDPAFPEMTLTISSTDLDSSTQESAHVIVSASGNYQSVSASCQVSSGEAAVSFSSVIGGSWGEHAPQTLELRDDLQSVYAYYQSDEESDGNGTLLETNLVAVAGSGPVDISCSVSGRDMFGRSKSRTQTLTLNITEPQPITGYVSLPNDFSPEEGINVIMVGDQGDRVEVTSDESGIFTLVNPTSETYQITFNYPNHVAECSTVNVISGDLGSFELTAGDLTGDGVIDSDDTRRIWYRSQYPMDYDLNNDGRVSWADAMVVYNNRGATQCEL